LTGHAEAEARTANANAVITIGVSIPYASISWLPGSQRWGGNLTGQYSLSHG
jgi:hypothetical protein